MIRIHRPLQTPDVLITAGTAERDKICRAFDASPSDYQSGRRKFTFDRRIYGHATVKDSLIAAQHKKCCFCEAKVGNDGDVEHFRPKSAVSQGKRTKLIRPGYFWPAYDWDNLLLCCSTCNTRHKRSLFTLVDRENRALTHHDSVAGESPLFIDPSRTDPELHIGFRREVPYARDGSASGRHTINALGLDREIMNERRRDRLGMLSALVDSLRALRLIDSPNEDVAEKVVVLQRLVRAALEDDAEFASMARCASIEQHWSI